MAKMMRLASLLDRPAPSKICCRPATHVERLKLVSSALFGRSGMENKSSTTDQSLAVTDISCVDTGRLTLSSSEVKQHGGAENGNVDRAVYQDTPCPAV